MDSSQDAAAGQIIPVRIPDYLHISMQRNVVVPVPSCFGERYVSGMDELGRFRLHLEHLGDRALEVSRGAGS